MLYTLLVLPAILAFPNFPKPWSAPTATDIRGPCPGLNTLANHGYINKNGTGLTAQAIKDGAYEAYSMDKAVLQAGAISPAFAILNVTVLPSLATLTQLPQHDISMSRHDKGLGEYIKVDPALVDQLLARSSTEDITTDAIIEQYKAQYDVCANKNTTCGWEWSLETLASESGVMFTLFGDENMTKVPKAWVESFLKEEKLPADFENRMMRFNQSLAVVIGGPIGTIKAACTEYFQTQAAATTTASPDPATTTDTTNNTATTASPDPATTTDTTNNTATTATPASPASSVFMQGSLMFSFVLPFVCL